MKWLFFGGETGADIADIQGRVDNEPRISTRRYFFWKVEYAKSPLVCRAADARHRKPAVMKRSGTMATADRRPESPGGPASHPTPATFG